MSNPIQIGTFAGDEAVRAASIANTKFGVALHQELAKSKPCTNLVHSPFSLSTIGAMLKLGSSGSTSDEIQQVFNFPVDNDKLVQAYGKVLRSLKENTAGFTLATANCLYFQSGFPILPKFSSAIRDGFQAKAQELNLADSAVAAYQINSWVANRTNQKIQDLISPDSLNERSRLVLVNGIYFKGLWKRQFSKSDTIKSPFYPNGATQLQVDMMSKKAKFPYVYMEALNSQVVELAYQGDRLSMLIILPKVRAGLEKVQELMQAVNHEVTFNEMNARNDVMLNLPRFRIESTHELMDPLRKMGLCSLFDENRADLSGISDQAKLFASVVVQKACIEVNEEGTEAAAGTRMGFGLTCMPELVEFTADHPFLFQIVDKMTNFVLFSGCVVNPNL